MTTPHVHLNTLLERVTFGRPVAEVLPQEIERVRARRVFVVTNRSLSTSPALRAIVESLGSTHAGTYSSVPAFTPRECVIEGALAARTADADLLLAFGGGSVIDATKAMLLCMRHGYTDTADLDPHAGVGYNNQQYGSPDASQWRRMVAVPTAFSAAEYTARGGVMDMRDRLKQSFSHPMMMAQVVINDPEMTRTAPMAMLLSTGMKAVDHAVERLTSKWANSYSDAVSTLALRLLREGLPALLRDPSDLALRADLQYGVFMSMAGLASGVTTGLSHAIGHALGSFAGVSHGHTSCLLLPSVMRWIGDVIPERQRLVCETLGRPGADAGAALESLIVGLGLPVRLGAVGVKTEDFETITERAMHDPLVANCPKPVAHADVRSILEAAL